ncbi:carbohydate-binding domain-containing protein [Serratia ureilytica]
MNAFKLSALAALTATMGFLGGMGHAMADQQLVDQLSQLKLNVKMLDNRAGENGVDCAALGADWASCNRVLFTLSNDGQAIDGKDWVIYFHSPRQTLRVDNDQFKIAHLTGDLYKLEPTAKFSGFPAGKAVEIPVVAEYWQLFRNDFLPRWYATSGDAKPKMLANTDTENLDQFVAPFTGDQWKRTKDDKNILMTPASRFVSNADLQTLPAGAARPDRADADAGESARAGRRSA